MGCQSRMIRLRGLSQRNDTSPNPVRGAVVFRKDLTLRRMSGRFVVNWGYVYFK